MIGLRFTKWTMMQTQVNTPFITGSLQDPTLTNGSLEITVN